MTLETALARGLAASPYLADRIRRDPDLVRAAAGEDGVRLGRIEGRAGFSDLLAQNAVTTDPDSLRRWAHREFCRLLLAERADSLPFPVVLAELSDLAEAILARVVKDLLLQDAARHGPADTPFTVFALGKLGGRDLNFSSDVDLLFLYGSDGADRGFERSERFARLSEKIVDLLARSTSEGFVYRVDLRLRPEGASGAVARSLDAALRYYERAGAAWERQALIKCRTVAGDANLGREFLDGIAPFVWRKTLDREAVHEIEEVKARILAQAASPGSTALRKGRNLKTGPGGIREIEFAVQVLQLLNGGRNPRVRATGTIEALEALAAQKYLLAEHAARWREDYLFLRRVEHLLQARDFRQTHLLPEGEQVMPLAVAMGFPDGVAFLARIEAISTDVRDLSEFHFRRGREISVTKTERHVLEALDEERDASAREAAVGELGFGPSALADLARLARGSRIDAPTSSVRRLFIRASDALLPRLARAAAPGEALARLSRILDRYGAKGSLYETFTRHDEVADLLARIVSGSSLLSRLLEEDPGALESLLAPGFFPAAADVGTLRARAEAYRASGLPSPAAVLWSEERIRLGVRHLLGHADAEEVGRGLAAAADLLAQEPYAFGFGIVAFGRWGRERLGFLSDLDIAFFAPPGADPEGSTKGVQSFLGTVERDDVFHLDARVRPAGRNAPILQSLDRFVDYLAREAEPWERVVWRSARVLCGQEKDRARIEAARDEILARPMSGAQSEAFWGVLARAQAEGTPRDPKRAPGGFLEMEYLLAWCDAQKDGALEIRTEVEDLRRRLEAILLAHQLREAAPWSIAPTDPDTPEILANVRALRDRISGREGPWPRRGRARSRRPWRDA